MKHRAIALGLFALAGCASAQMRLPETLAASERTQFVGIGGWASGHFTAGVWSGDYARSAERLSYLRPIVENRGASRFSLNGPEGDTVTGQCRMRERSVDFGLIEVTTRPMAYRCEIAAGASAAGWLELQEFNGPGAAMNRYERRGTAQVAGETVTIRSVHHLAGTSLPTSAPIGYLFEQDGKAVGAVELNGRPVLNVAPGASPQLRHALAISALALGVLWDPANLDT
jgi:hypothetical protein